MCNLLLRNCAKFSRLLQRGNIRPYHSSWSPLANRFNTSPSENGQLSCAGTGLLDIPELETAAGFKDLTQNVIDQTDRLIAEAMSPNRNRKMTEVFDDLSNELCKVADMAEYIRIGHSQESYRNAAEEASWAIGGIVERLNTNAELYGHLKRVVDGGDSVATSDMDQHVASMFLHDFQQSGIHCADTERHQIVALTDRILQAGQKFMANTMHQRQFPNNAVPDQIKGKFPNAGGHILVSGLHADSDNPLVREAAYKMYLYPDVGQQQLLTDILKNRQELATVCGFPTYAHRALTSGTVETPESVNEFLDKTASGLRPIADTDFSIMRGLKKAQLNQTELYAWDVPYYTNKYKKNWLQSSASNYSPYFSLGACMEGLNHVFHSLYGVTLEYAEMKPGETWHYDIYKLNVVHETEGELGTIYCDFYDRAGKPNQDSHFTIRGGKLLSDGSYQNPIVVVMLSMPSPKWGRPTLLSPSMLDNLFHELGHAMHSMLGRTQYQHVSGTRCSTDFAEVPSILMEYFSSDERVLSKFARHYQTGEPMPADQLKRMCASKHLFTASETQQQLFYSALDQRLHGRFHEWSRSQSTTDILREAQEQYYSIPYVTDTAWELRFTHLIGYGAKYYAYLVSRAIASSIWYTYFEAEPLNREQGERFRRECLGYGGAVPSKQLAENFLKQEVTPSYLSNNLIKDIEKNNEQINSFSQ